MRYRETETETTDGRNGTSTCPLLRRRILRRFRSRLTNSSTRFSHLPLSQNPRQLAPRNSDRKFPFDIAEAEHQRCNVCSSEMIVLVHKHVIIKVADNGVYEEETIIILSRVIVTERRISTLEYDRPIGDQ